MTTQHATVSRVSCGLFFALMLAFIPVSADADHQPEGVTLFQHVHFSGRSETFYGDVASLRGTYLGNDQATSVAVPRGCQVTLFRDKECRGPSITVRRDVADLSKTWLGNDQVSSLSVSCDDRPRGRRSRDDRRYDDRGRWDGDEGYPRYDDDRRYDDGPRDRGNRYGRNRGDIPRGVTVFEAGDFRGRRETFTYDDPDLRDNRVRHDHISSVVVSPGCRAVLFEHNDFRGARTVVEGRSIANMRYTTVGNDRVSSIQVDCRRRW